MRLLRGLGGALLWLVASLLGLVAVILCVTLVLLPLGIALFKVVGRMYTAAVRLMLPRAAAHPIKALKPDTKKLQQLKPDTKKLRKKMQLT